MEEIKYKDEGFADIARLRSSWIMTEASKMMEAKNCSRSFALIQAWRTWRLLDAMSCGKVVFWYQKKNGDSRCAIGTLAKGADSSFDAYLELHDNEVRPPKKETPCNFVYWDCEKKAFRTFKSYELLHDHDQFNYSGILNDIEDESDE